MRVLQRGSIILQTIEGMGDYKPFKKDLHKIHRL